MNESIGTMNVGEHLNDEETLRGQRARARWPCCDYGQWGVLPGMLVPPEEAQDDLSGQNPYTGRSLAPLPAPPVAPRDFVVRVGDGWGGPLHELADALAVWERGASAAAGVLLSAFEFVELEAEGVRGRERLLEGIRLLRGAVMLAGSGQRLEGAGWMMEADNWDRGFWDRLGR